MSCNYRGNNFLESDESFSISLHLISIFEAPILIFGIYIILKKTPKLMEKVKFPIIVLHFLCTWGDIFVSVLSTPVFLFPSTAGYPLGVLYYVMPTWLLCYLGYATIGLIGPSVILLFENRYNLLVRKDSETTSRKVKRFFHHLFNSVYTLLSVVPPFTNLVEFPNFREMVHQEVPCLPEKIIQHPRLYYLNTNARTIFMCLFFFLVLVLVQSFFFLIATCLHLFKTSEFRSSRTTRLQMQLFKAMCIQTVLPIIFLIMPASYYLFIFATGHFDLLLNNLCIFCYTLHGTFSTIVMLIVHEPYRKSMLQIFKIYKVVQPSRSCHLSLRNCHIS